MYGGAMRLVDRTYRLNSNLRSKWKDEIDSLFEDGDPKDEPKARNRLCQLAREVNLATAEWTRRTAEKAAVLFFLNAIGLIFIVACAIFIWLYSAPTEMTFTELLLPVALAGGVGSAISAMRGMREEKLRDEYLKLLTVQIVIRSLLGLFYSSFVFACAFSGVLPIKIPDAEQLPFYLALGFVAGFSDSIFGDTVSRFVAEPTSKSKKE